MKVAVIIPAYNSAAFLDEAIESVRRQTLEDFELIIVNDGSTDDTSSIVRRYCAIDSRIRLIEQENGGIAAALNRGLRDVSDGTEYVSILGHDDVWEPCTLEALVAALESDPAAAAAYGSARYIDESGSPIRVGEMERFVAARRAIRGRRTVPLTPCEPTTFGSIVCMNYVPASAAAVRKSVLDLVGPFDPECTGAEDWDMWIRVSVHGYLICLPQVLLNYRIHGGNMTGNKRMIDDACGRVRQKHIRSMTLDSARRQTVITAARLASRSDARLRVGWAVTAARRGNVIEVAKQARHAVKDYLRSLAIPGQG